MYLEELQRLHSIENKIGLEGKDLQEFYGSKELLLGENNMKNTK